MPEVKKDQFVSRFISEFEDVKEADGDMQCKFCSIKVWCHALANDMKCGMSKLFH